MKALYKIAIATTHNNHSNQAFISQEYKMKAAQGLVATGNVESYVSYAFMIPPHNVHDDYRK